MREFCPNCKHNVNMTEAELYCAYSAYGSGDTFDWCEVYNDFVNRVAMYEPNLNDCEEFEESDNACFEEWVDDYYNNIIIKEELIGDLEEVNIEVIGIEEE